MREYQQFPISNFRTGFNQSLEPWLLPRDAYQYFKNCHLYRGVLEKISGYKLYAPMSYRTEVALSPFPDGIVTTFTGTLSAKPSSNNFLVTAAINGAATLGETFQYSGETLPDIINLTSSNLGTGTINTTTLAISVTFGTPPPAITVGVPFNTVMFLYDTLSTASAGDKDIMGIFPYYAQDGSQEIIIFDTNTAGKIVAVDSTIVGTYVDADYAVSEIPHTVQVQDQPKNQAFDGVRVTFSSAPPGTALAAPIVPGTVKFLLYDNATPPTAVDPYIKSTITDNGFGLLTGLGTIAGTGFVNYLNGNWTFTFGTPPLATDRLNSFVGTYGTFLTGDYTNFISGINYQYKLFFTNSIDNIRYYDGTQFQYLITKLIQQDGEIGSLQLDITTCLHVAVNRERLLLLLPTRGSKEQNAIYWSRAGLPTDFTNGEVALAATSQPIRDFSFINTDMIVRFASGENVFRYTEDAFKPFRFDPTNNNWRCDTNYSSINYDKAFTTVGKAAIVASDGVNVQRADAVIPDFTLNDRAQLEGPLISIDQTSIGQCYGERFDDFKEGWLCFKAYSPISGGQVERSDNVLAFNYLDDTYAVYTFPFNCLGFGAVLAVDTWGNDYTTWESDDEPWSTAFESLNALVDLAGDRNGNVYVLGTSNQMTDTAGEYIPLTMDVITKNFNPFLEEGQLCRFGYLDLFVSANAATTLHVQFYRDDTMVLDPDGTPTGAYQETVLTFLPTDAMSPTTSQNKIWKRIYVGAVAKEHTIRFYQDASDFENELDQPVRIHSMVLYMKPAGQVFN